MKDLSSQTSFENEDDELAMLLAGDVLGDLDDSEKLRLEELSASAEQLDGTRESLARVADFIGNAPEGSRDHLPSSDEEIQMPLNPELAEKIRRDAIAYFPAGKIENPTRSKVGFLTSSWVGWCVAACLAVVCINLWFAETRDSQSPVAAIVTSERSAQQWMRSHPKAINLKWEIKDPSMVVSETQPGGLVWDAGSQSGFMSFKALPVNDAAVQQYQLWIIDPKRDDEPIDGGVFDIVRAGESIVPILAKLDVIEPVGFAVTVEKPGGVVVSDQSRLPLLAMVPK